MNARPVVPSATSLPGAYAAQPEAMTAVEDAAGAELDEAADGAADVETTRSEEERVVS